MLKEKIRKKMSLSEFAEIAGISKSNAWRLVKRGELPVLEIGKRLILNTDDVELFIRRHTRPVVKASSILVDRILRAAGNQ